MWLETIKLAFGNNLIMGHCPANLSMDRVAEKTQKEPVVLEQFGLFDRATPNYTNYYPDVKAEDLAPKESEFIEPIFRALSEVVVHKTSNPVDFSRNGILKKSMPLLLGQSIYADHESAIGNAMGAVSEVHWQGEYKVENGILVPSGINAKMKIDGKSNPRIARGIMMDPPSIHSTSVTVRFMWDKSHPAMSDADFFGKLGTYDKDGGLITRVAATIKNYNEISLVGHGADPFAQRVDKDGKIINPQYAAIAYNGQNTPDAIKARKNEKYFFFDIKEDIILNSEKNTIPEISNDNEQQKSLIMNPILLAFAAVFVLTPTAGEEEAAFQARILAAMEKQKTDSAIALAEAIKNATPEAEITRLKGIETTYNAEKATMVDSVANKAFHDKVLGDARIAALAAYNKSTDNKPNQAIVDLITNSTDIKVIQTLTQQYNEAIDKKFPIACKKCGSHEVTRASAATTEDDDETENTTTEKDNDSTVAGLRDNYKKRGSQLKLTTGAVIEEVKK